MLEGIKIKIQQVQVQAKPKLNFNTNRRAEGNVNKIAWLEDKTVTQVVDMWKKAHSRKKLTQEETTKFEEVKYYLKNKFNIEVPK